MAENEQSTTPQLKGGDTIYVNDKKYTVSGWATLKNGENRMILSNGLSPSGYIDSNNNFQKLKNVSTDRNNPIYEIDGEKVSIHDAEFISNGRVEKLTFTASKRDLDYINTTTTISINEEEVRNAITIVEELIKKCKTGKDEVDEYANQMKSAVSNIRSVRSIRNGSGDISSVRIEELIELLEKFKKQLEDVLGETKKYDPDSDTPIEKDSKAKNWYEHYYGGANPPINNVDKNYTDEELAKNPDDRDVARRAINLSSPFNSTNNTKPDNDTPDYRDPDPAPLPTTPVTEAPTVPITERPTEVITQPTTSAPVTEPTPAPSAPVTEPTPAPSNDNYSNNYSSNNDNYYGYGNENAVVQTEAPTNAPVEEEDIIIEGNKYKLPTSSPMSTTTTTTTTSKGNTVIPVLAGLAAAAAAGIGAKTYMDRKKNRDNDEEIEDFKTEDWSNNDDINIEYQDPQENNIESLDDDNYAQEEPEKYGARTHQELEDLQ